MIWHLQSPSPAVFMIIPEIISSLGGKIIPFTSGKQIYPPPHQGGLGIDSGQRYCIILLFLMGISTPNYYTVTFMKVLLINNWKLLTFFVVSTQFC